MVNMVFSGKHTTPVWLIVQILFYKGRRKANQQCYKGHGECDCTGLCRENC
jgi:hypothetical protein